jgi:hypothetical protein
MKTQRLTRFTAFLAPAVMLMGLAGCHEPDERPIPGRGEIYDRPWLTLGSGSLHYDTRIGDARPTRDANGFLQVAVPVRNVTDKQLYIDCRITFLDAAGNEINTYPTTLTIPARQSRDAVGNATSAQAKDFHVEMNYPRIN